MKKIYLFIFLFNLWTAVDLSAQRYQEPVFDDVEVTKGVQYAKNITIITGAPAPTDLLVDIYEPASDDYDERPLVAMVHTGSFLPVPLNGQPTGTREDTSLVDFATRLAKAGYVVGIIDYRQGWNPLDTTAELRRRGLINAAYRGVQDLRTFFRFMRANQDEWGIDENRFAAYGQGTGGYIVLAAATLDKQEEIFIPKFQDEFGNSFIDTNLLGNMYGTSDKPLNIPNHVGFSSDFSFSFNAGGALGDISWLEEDNIPLATVHVINDPFAPFGINPGTGLPDPELPVIVPTTGEFVVNVAGPRVFIEKANELGVNDPIDNPPFYEEITQAAMQKPFYVPHLFPIIDTFVQSAPWEYWDPQYWSQLYHPSCGAVQPPDCSFHTISLMTNPNMSKAKSEAYVDTIYKFFLPRAYLALDITTSADDIDAKIVGLNTYPNPASEYVLFSVARDVIIRNVEIFDMNGKSIDNTTNINASTWKDNSLGNRTAGVYFYRIITSKGITTERIFKR